VAFIAVLSSQLLVERRHDRHRVVLLDRRELAVGELRDLAPGRRDLVGIGSPQ
jgi:hypothetical protein